MTLSFLVATPECGVPALDSSEYGFRLLSSAVRLVVKDALMADAALVTMADSAKVSLWKRNAVPEQGLALAHDVP